VRSLSISNSNMTRRWGSALAFVLLVVVLDWTLGFGFGYLYKKTRTGEAGGFINAALSTKAQVLLLGSSRMRHHVDPAVLNRSLSLSVYNAGQDGQGFLYAAMLMDLWQRSNAPPRAIVLHVDWNSFTKDEDELKRSSIFSFYLGDSDLVREIIYQRSALEPIKYVSYSFRANGKVLPIIKNLFASHRDLLNGFRPLSGTMPITTPSQKLRTPSPQAGPPYFWDLKVKCFKRLAAYCRQNGTRVFLFHSPQFAEERARHDAWIAALRVFLADYPDVDFIEISEFTRPDIFANRPELFVDSTHLNAKGAETVSSLLASELKARLDLSLAAATQQLRTKRTIVLIVDVTLGEEDPTRASGDRVLSTVQ
jgi:hypothetical protein